MITQVRGNGEHCKKRLSPLSISVTFVSMVMITSLFVHKIFLNRRNRLLHI
uniref:Transmembrane protein n=1 Tax=Arundo donax TaxID=35708 RepID=A0A0A9CBF6_ARUDO